MKRPSERALDLAEAVLDHVRRGLTRADALHELAEMVDENKEELLRAVQAVARNTRVKNGASDAASLAQLRELLRHYQPWLVATSDREELIKNTSAAPTLL